MDVVTEDIKMRIEAVRDAIKRSRLALIVAVIASASTLLALWNAYFSWYRSFAMQSALSTNAVTGEAQRELLSGWVDSQIMSISLLGIRIGVSDLAFIGSLALAVAAGCFFYAARKENHLIARLLKDTKDMTADIRRLVYHGVVGYLVFITITDDDRPVRNLKEGDEGKPIFFLRPAMKLLHFLPAAVIFLVVAADLLSLYGLPAAFRSSHTPLAAHLDLPDWLEFGIMEASAVALFVLTCVLCRRSFEFGEATREVLDEYETRLGPLMAYRSAAQVAPASPDQDAQAA